MEKKALLRFNFFILFSVLGLLTIGLLAIYSATYGNEVTSANFTKQVIAGGVGLLLAIVITFLPPRYLSSSAILAYVSVIILLVAVLLLGRKTKGHASWFHIAGFGFQPSEFAKVAVVLTLASFLSNRQKDADMTKPKDFFWALAIGVFPVGLISLQPDTGTSLVFLAMLLPMLYWAGLPNFILFSIVVPVATAISAFFGTWYFMIALGIILLSLRFFKKSLLISTLVFSMAIISGLSVNIMFNKLQPYQQKRIMNMFSPETDALGSGYNVIQAKIAIGSGGLWGKGYLQGTQTQLKYIPEQWTDFIFCMVGEEFGFAGSFLVICLFATLIWQTITIAYNCKNKFLSICCIGFASIFTFHLLINMGMTIGIMPIIGIPLPFMSYGVTFLISDMVMVGIIMNAYRNRKEYV